MNKMISLACLSFAFVVSVPAHAGKQQDKMKSCSKEAKDGGMKGDKRKAFMKKCLSKDGKMKVDNKMKADIPEK